MGADGSAFYIPSGTVVSPVGFTGVCPIVVGMASDKLKSWVNSGRRESKVEINETNNDGLPVLPLWDTWVRKQQKEKQMKYGRPNTVAVVGISEVARMLGNHVKHSSIGNAQRFKEEKDPEIALEDLLVGHGLQVAAHVMIIMSKQVGFPVEFSFEKWITLLEKGLSD